VAEFRIVPEALRDLDAISKYIEERDSEGVALRVEPRIFEVIAMLARLPQVGHRRQDLRQPDLRFFRVYRYMIVFRREPRVVILRVLHGARDLARIFKQL
jgi:plasmid stabilization system protein ParE